MNTFYFMLRCHKLEQMVKRSVISFVLQSIGWAWALSLFSLVLHALCSQFYYFVYSFSKFPSLSANLIFIELKLTETLLMKWKFSMRNFVIYFVICYDFFSSFYFVITFIWPTKLVLCVVLIKLKSVVVHIKENVSTIFPIQRPLQSYSASSREHTIEIIKK